MKAQTLRQLFEIREHNRALLDSFDTLGTALGLKNGKGDPAVLVFVHQKIGEPWLRSGQVVPATLSSSGGLTCPTDVIAGDSDRNLQVRVFDGWETDLGLRPLQQLVATNPLSSQQLELRDALRGNTKELTPGCQLAFRDESGEGFFGTLSCFAQKRTGGQRGFLTNHHIGRFRGNLLFFPTVDHAPVGVFEGGVLLDDVATRYGVAPASGPDDWLSRVRIDAAFCAIHPHVDWTRQVDPQLPVIGASGVGRQRLGHPLPLNLDSMGPVGEDVVGVGRTRSYQTGTIRAFAFEFVNREDGHREYCDYLIVNDDQNEFSDPGDSGKLVVTKQGLRPVAIMWGGEWSRRRHGQELENWTNATDVSLILNRLDVDLVL